VEKEKNEKEAAAQNGCGDCGRERGDADLNRPAINTTVSNIK
jgi:hypothetical protein